MSNELLSPDYIFESSWEVCNKVGGIYTVLSSRAKTLQEAFPDHVFDFLVYKFELRFREVEDLAGTLL